MSGPTLVEFKRDGWRDAVAALECILERLKSGEIRPVSIGCLVMVDADNALATYGFGPQAEDLQMLAVLELGKMQIMDSAFGV